MEKINSLKDNYNADSNDQLKHILDTKLNKIDDDIKDLTHLSTYSIDDFESIEIDDAISLEYRNSIPIIWIHISCPANYIDLDTPLDLEARRKASTIYMTTSTETMFPRELILSKLSISTQNKVPAISLGVQINEKGEIIDYEIINSFVKSSFKLNYQEADELIDLAPKEDPNLYILSTLLSKRRNWRKKNGSIDFPRNTSRIIIQNNKLSLFFLDESKSRKLVEEAMILMGTVISDYSIKNHITIPFRCHDKVNDNNQSIEYNDIYQNYKKRFSLRKSYVSIKPSPHSTLGLISYVQCTSPIRRYIDLLTHYQIFSFLKGYKLISDFDMNLLINTYRSNYTQAVNIMNEDKKYYQKQFLLTNNTTNVDAILLRWIRESDRLALVHFVDYSFDYVVELIYSKQLKPGYHIILSLKPSTTNQSEEYQVILKMYVK
tara:strand:- start:2150 stop:3451 length:1302 start_codon:yes stop_codon:yes gene_type:complete